MGRLLFSFLSLCIGIFSAEVSARQVCGANRSGFFSEYKWCANLGSAKTVLYYMHGNGGNEQSWASPDHQVLENAWGKDAPTIVTVSFGPTWFLTDSLQSTFIQKVIPTIESELRLRPSERVLMGESMGGFNALQVYLKSPQMFSRFVVGCPAVLNFSPYASNTEVDSFVARHTPYVVPKLVYKWRDKLRSTFSSERDWAQHDPLRLAGLVTSAQPDLFMFDDGQDSFGFQEASTLIQARLKQRGAAVEYHHVPAGGHCQIDPQAQAAMAKFLVPPQALVSVNQ